MAVDYIRQDRKTGRLVTYETDMQFDPDGVAAPVRVRWYGVPEGTPRLPFITPFGSRRLSETSGIRWPDLGEVEGTQRIVPDRPPDPTPPALHPCGGPVEWANGVRPPWPARAAGPGGSCSCCFAPVFVGGGRCLESGTAYVRHFNGFGVERESGLARLVRHATFAGRGLEYSLGTAYHGGGIFHGHGIELERGAARLLSHHTLLGQGKELESGRAVLSHRRSLYGLGLSLELGLARLVSRRTVKGHGSSLETGLARLLSHRLLKGSGRELESGFARLAHGFTLRGSGKELESGAVRFNSRRVLGGSGIELESGAAKWKYVRVLKGAGRELEKGAATLKSHRLLKGAGTEEEKGGATFGGVDGWTVVQYGYNQALVGASSNLKVTMPATVTVGNLVVAFLGVFSPGTNPAAGTFVDNHGTTQGQVGAASGASGTVRINGYEFFESGGTPNSGPNWTAGATLQANSLAFLWVGEFVATSATRTGFVGSGSGTTLNLAFAGLAQKPKLFVMAGVSKGTGGSWSGFTSGFNANQAIAGVALTNPAWLVQMIGNTYATSAIGLSGTISATYSGGTGANYATSGFAIR